MSLTINNTASAAYATSPAKSAITTTKEYMESLKEKYPDVDISVKNITGTAQLKAHAMSSIGSFGGVTIAKNIMEKMATDPKTAEKYEPFIESMPETVEYVKKATADMGMESLAFGVNIDKNGKVNYWGVCRSEVREGPDKPTMKETVQKNLAEKRAKAKEEAKASEADKEKENSKPSFIFSSSEDYSKLFSEITKNNQTTATKAELKLDFKV